MFDRFVKFHISLPTSGLNLSFGHLLMDLKGENIVIKVESTRKLQWERMCRNNILCKWWQSAQVHTLHLVALLYLLCLCFIWYALSAKLYILCFICYAFYMYVVTSLSMSFSCYFYCFLNQQKKACYVHTNELSDIVTSWAAHCS